ncbi:serine O-acetyltransferase [Asticcacaulis sp. EMRT-3]|uniref:serine O-acetyltransferase n=1 Tax=Asticcacaulis sp. EMRT-3 TaxID=3040349 RepID=UPI0024AFF336|nr:serine O-acetyltransferase [Asticcacaulis sp. EMRT-3]MDI7773980.1 serine O-acetyltransferase [Asticcacaulis sp. EMRT-3]
MAQHEAKAFEVIHPDDKPIWLCLRQEAQDASAKEPALASMLHSTILSHGDLASALSYHIARKLGDDSMSSITLRELAQACFASDALLVDYAEADLQAVYERDPAAKGYMQAFMYFKGFLSLQIYRVSHCLWTQGRTTMAHYLQSRVSELFQIDINPAARIGKGVFLDHGTGIVIGETAVVGDDCSILQGVTLGGTGAERGDRHPKIGKGVLLGAGANVLGNIQIGDYAKIASGSVVLRPVPAHCTAAGVPAKIVNCKTCEDPARQMDHTMPEIDLDYSI